MIAVAEPLADSAEEDDNQLLDDSDEAISAADAKAGTGPAGTNLQLVGSMLGVTDGMLRDKLSVFGKIVGARVDKSSAEVLQGGALQGQLGAPKLAYITFKDKDAVTAAVKGLVQLFKTRPNEDPFARSAHLGAYMAGSLKVMVKTGEEGDNTAAHNASEQGMVHNRAGLLGMMPTVG